MFEFSLLAHLLQMLLGSKMLTIQGERCCFQKDNFKTDPSKNIRKQRRRQCEACLLKSHILAPLNSIAINKKILPEVPVNVKTAGAVMTTDSP